MPHIYEITFLGRCKDEDCDSEDNDWRSGARSLDDPQSDAVLQQAGDGALMASYSVFVVEPGEDIGKFHIQEIIYLLIKNHGLPFSFSIQYSH